MLPAVPQAPCGQAGGVSALVLCGPEAQGGRLPAPGRRSGAGSLMAQLQGCILPGTWTLLRVFALNNGINISIFTESCPCAKQRTKSCSQGGYSLVGKQFTTRFDINQTACQRRTWLRRGERRGEAPGSSSRGRASKCKGPEVLGQVCWQPRCDQQERAQGPEAAELSGGGRGGRSRSGFTAI